MKKENMKKARQKLQKAMQESKMTCFTRRKVGKFWTYGALLVTVFGATSGSALSVQAAAFQPPLADTNVNWTAGTTLLKVNLANGQQSEVDFLSLDDGTMVLCLALGIPLSNASTQAQLDAMNGIWTKLSPEEQALINNVSFAARKQGANQDMALYSGAQLAVWELLEEYGAAVHQATSFEIGNHGQAIGLTLEAVNQHKNNLLKEARRLREKPSFDQTTVDLIQGQEKMVEDKNNVLSLFPFVTNTAQGLNHSVSGNQVKLLAGINSPLGIVNSALTFLNSSLAADQAPWWIFTTAGDQSGVESQPVIASQDPSRLDAALHVRIVGLGETKLTKHDADTDSTLEQGAAHLTGSVWGLYEKGTNKMVNWSDGQDGYPITVTAGEKADETLVKITLTDLEVVVAVKNLPTNKDYEWGEVQAPEGYELSTKRYPVDFNASSSFNPSDNNFIEDVTAVDRVGVFALSAEKVQDSNGSLIPLDGAEFTLTPQEGTVGQPIKVTSETVQDENGVLHQGQIKFDGKANQQAGNASPDGIAHGDYLLEETKAPDGLKPINPIFVDAEVEMDEKGAPKAYDYTITDTVTHQVLSKVSIDADKLVDNNILFKLDLGLLTNRPVEEIKPTIKTKAHTVDGDQTIQVVEQSKETPVYDKVELTNAEHEDQLVAQLHRLVTDKDNKVLEEKVVKTLNFTVDD